MKLNLYSISDKYIKYLRKFEDKIYDNKEEIRVRTRKYLGIVLTINNNVEKITKNAKIVYNQRIKNENIGYIKNTVNFKLLEEKLEEWNKM